MPAMNLNKEHDPIGVNNRAIFKFYYDFDSLAYTFLKMQGTQLKVCVVSPMMLLNLGVDSGRDEN